MFRENGTCLIKEFLKWEIEVAKKYLEFLELEVSEDKGTIIPKFPLLKIAMTLVKSLSENFCNGFLFWKRRKRNERA